MKHDIVIKLLNELCYNKFIEVPDDGLSAEILHIKIKRKKKRRKLSTKLFHYINYINT